MAEKIMIVDDDIETLRLVGLMLQRQGYEILAASNGTQAIGMARSDKPDLIVLDVMMPDMDGYQVTSELRKDAELAETPILMFTAKSQVDDKVAGYDAGIDDYLTKPVHPAELVAHIKALLSRTRVKQTAPLPLVGSYVVGIVGCKGGLGASTLAINLAADYATATKGDVIAVEMKSGQGTWANELGFTTTEGLANLLKLKPSEINPAIVEQNLTNTGFGVRMLLASNLSLNIDYCDIEDKYKAILQALTQLSPLVILDIGSPFMPGFDKICARCKEIFLVTEPNPNTIRRTKILFEELRTIGSGSARMIELVLYNRIRSDVQLTTEQIAEMMGSVPVTCMIPPAPEQAYQASIKKTLLIQNKPDGFVSQQFRELTKIMQSHMIK